MELYTNNRYMSKKHSGTIFALWIKPATQLKK